MIYRFMFVGYTENIRSVKIKPDQNCYAALSYKGKNVYMYVESNDPGVNPEDLVVGDLLPYPDGRKWDRAIDIYHYSTPLNAEQWRRKAENKKPYVRLNKLRPEKISSYIFFHYQLQEERPGDGERYGVIYLYGDTLIFYQENPFERETEKLPGLLQTDLSPLDRWNELMEEHFADTWREIDNLDFTGYCEFE